MLDYFLATGKTHSKKSIAVESREGSGDSGSCTRTGTTVLHRKALRRRYYWPCPGDDGGRGGVEWANDRRMRPSLEMQRWKTPEERLREEAREASEGQAKSGKSRSGHYHHKKWGKKLSLLVSIQVAILLLFMSAWDSSTWVHAQGCRTELSS